VFNNLISFYNYFFSAAVKAAFREKKKINGIMASLVPGGCLALRYFSRRLSFSFTSVFVPDVFTNKSIYGLTEYYESGNEVKFNIISEPNFCWFFSSDFAKDYLLFRHLSRGRAFMLTFSRNEDVINASDIYFPFRTYGVSDLFAALLLSSILFFRNHGGPDLSL